MYTNELRDILENIQNDSTIESIVQRLVSLKDNLGFDDVVYVILDHPEIAANQPKTVCTYSQNWIDYYYDNNLFNIDPVIRTSQQTAHPFSWKNIQFSRNEQKFMNSSSDFGVARHGYSIPIRHGQHEFAMLSVTSKGNDEYWADLEHESIPIIKMLAHYYHNKFVTILNEADAAPEVPHLTDREKECLLWSARGKSAWETAQILKIAERTVTFHTNNACKKLGTSNRMMAVVQAIQQKIIFI